MLVAVLSSWLPVPLDSRNHSSLCSLCSNFTVHFISKCRENGFALVAAGAGLGVAPKAEPILSAPLTPRNPPQTELIQGEQGEAEGEAEGVFGLLSARIARIPQLGFASHAHWIIQHTMYLFELRNVTMQFHQKSLRNKGLLLQSCVKELSLRRPRVRWRVQVSRQKMTRHTRIQARRINMVAGLWRSSPPPLWRFEPVSRTFWFWRFNDVCLVILVLSLLCGVFSVKKNK